MKYVARHRWLVLAALFLVGCGEGPPGNPAAPPGSPSSLGANQQAWRGLLACADCEGIDTYLVLDRGGSPARYALEETFLADGGGEQFREQGQWRLEGRWLRLQSDAGGQRVFALEGDGGLSVGNGDGSPALGEGRLLAPVTAPSPP